MFRVLGGFGGEMDAHGLSELLLRKELVAFGFEGVGHNGSLFRRTGDIRR